MTPYELKEINNYLTNVDSPDLPQDYAVELRGGFSRQDGSVFSRDFGTVLRVSPPVPIRPNVFKTISGAANNGSGLIRITSTSHGYSTSDVVYIDEIVGTVEAIGKWTITVINSSTYDLQGSAFANAYTSGGISTKTPITIVRDFTFIDSTTNTEYNGIVGLDSNNLQRIYVYDPASTEASKWIELTRKFDALINDTIGASDTNFDFDTLTENGVSYTGSADFVNNWIVVNTSQSNETVFIVDSTASNLTVDTVVGSNGLGWANNDVLEIYRFPCMKFNYTYSNGATPSINFLAVETQRKLDILYQATDGAKRQPVQLYRRSARNYFYTAFGLNVLTSNHPRQSIPLILERVQSE